MNPRGHWWHRLRPKRKTSRTPAAATPTPLTSRRIGEVLSHHDFTYRVDEDGDLTGLWDGHPFWFMLRGETGEVLQVLGQWSVPVPESARMAVLQAVNDWNRDQVLPKAYLRAEEESLTLYADHAIILQGGATDEQLDQILLGTLGTTLRLFNALTGQLPSAA